ncbi:MAG: hypothetical protein AAF348_01925 [Bacteroidota bacterium]
MKTIQLMNAAIFCMTLTLGACSNGEDGTDGLPGADGASCWDLNGNGTGDAEEDVNNDGNFDALDCQGEQGAAGNANVFRIDIPMDEFSGHLFEYNLTDNFITLEDIPNYAWFVYISNGSTIYPVPGPLTSNVTYARYYLQDDGILRIRFFNTIDDMPYDVFLGEYIELWIIAIEALVQSPGKGVSQSILYELKAAGVDTNDYSAVANYFGLE